MIIDFTEHVKAILGSLAVDLERGIDTLSASLEITPKFQTKESAEHWLCKSPVLLPVPRPSAVPSGALQALLQRCLNCSSTCSSAAQAAPSATQTLLNAAQALLQASGSLLRLSYGKLKLTKQKKTMHQHRGLLRKSGQIGLQSFTAQHLILWVCLLSAMWISCRI
jgi:hypothetical protein